MHITVQTRYHLQYPTMRLGGYMDSLTEPAFTSLKNDMEYLMHHPEESIMYSKKKVAKIMKAPTTIFQIRRCINQQNQEYSNFLHTYYDADHTRDLYERLSVTSTVHIFNSDLIDW